MANINELLNNRPELDPITDLINTIMELSDDSLTEQAVESMKGMLAGAITPAIHQQMVDDTLASYRAQNYTRAQAITELNDFYAAINELLDELQPTEKKKELITYFFSLLTDTIQEANSMYLTHDIDLPMTLEKDAHEPTYAHETDAAADLYAKEDYVVPAHSMGNKIGTGVRIALPEGWVAHIAPRSSIGAKTPLRLSNMLGIIDAHYRGELIILFDNISDSDYIIHANDRIAQLWVCPSYHFQAQVVEELEGTDRGEGGIGSTGK